MGSCWRCSWRSGWTVFSCFFAMLQVLVVVVDCASEALMLSQRTKDIMRMRSWARENKLANGCLSGSRMPTYIAACPLSVHSNLGLTNKWMAKLHHFRLCCWSIPNLNVHWMDKQPDTKPKKYCDNTYKYRSKTFNTGYKLVRFIAQIT